MSDIPEKQPTPNKTVCGPNLQSMKDWIELDPNPGDKDNCRPCLLQVPIAWYHDELTERGLKPLSDKLEEAQKTAEPVVVAEVMDQIKQEVPVEVAERLQEFDCSTQNFESDGVEGV